MHTLKSYLPIIPVLTLLISGIVTSTLFYSRVESQVARIDAIEARELQDKKEAKEKDEKYATDIRFIRESLVRINTVMGIKIPEPKEQ